MVITLPVMLKTMIWKQGGITIYFPQMIHYNNSRLQRAVNEVIQGTVYSLIRRQQIQQGTKDFLQMIGTFEIKTNERNVLCITFRNYAYVTHYAHGLTFLQSVNIDLRTGENVPLGWLFNPESDYQSILSKFVAAQIKERNLPLINPFSGVSENQDYYIADKCLVLYYQIYDLTPYYYGIPFFPISVYALENTMTETSILNRMIG